MNRHPQARREIQTHRIYLRGCRDSAALRLHFSDEGGGSLRVVAGNIFGNVGKVGSGAW